jgi:FixJ family two-component response regulator
VVGSVSKASLRQSNSRGHITALENERLHVQVIHRGAVECLVKPFSETALIEALQRAGAQP